MVHLKVIWLIWLFLNCFQVIYPSFSQIKPSDCCCMVNLSNLENLKWQAPAFYASSFYLFINVQFSGRILHRKTSSQDSSASSSSDHTTLVTSINVAPASDLRGTWSPPASPRAVSPGLSPMGSPQLGRGDGASLAVEKSIRLSKGSDQLGMSCFFKPISFYF